MVVTMNSYYLYSGDTLPAEHIEDLVLTQVQQALSAPAIMQAVWDQVRASTDRLTEPEVVLPMRQLGKFWPQLFPAEQHRLVRLLAELVIIGDSGLEIVWHDCDWKTLASELQPGTIGAELAEMEDVA